MLVLVLLSMVVPAYGDSPSARDEFILYYDKWFGYVFTIEEWLSDPPTEAIQREPVICFEYEDYVVRISEIVCDPTTICMNIELELKVPIGVIRVYKMVSKQDLAFDIPLSYYGNETVYFLDFELDGPVEPKIGYGTLGLTPDERRMNMIEMWCAPDGYSAGEAIVAYVHIKIMKLEAGITSTETLDFSIVCPIVEGVDVLKER